MRRSRRRPMISSKLHGSSYGVTTRLAPACLKRPLFAFATNWSVLAPTSEPDEWGLNRLPFPIDRRALANHPDLGLTEAKVREAIRTLEKVGFLDRAIPGKGSRHKLTGTGELHRKPVLFQFGSDYAASFSMANRRAQAAR